MLQAAGEVLARLAAAGAWPCSSGQAARSIPLGRIWDLIKQLLAKRRGMGPVDGPEMTNQSSDVHFHRPLR